MDRTVSLGKIQPLVTSHGVTVLPCSNAAKLSCDLCGFETTKTKPSKARQKMQAHGHTKHPQLDILGDGTVSLGKMQLLVTEETPPVIKSKGEHDPVLSLVPEVPHCPDFFLWEGTSLVSDGEDPCV